MWGGGGNVFDANTMEEEYHSIFRNFTKVLNDMLIQIILHEKEDYMKTQSSRKIYTGRKTER